MTSPIPPVPEQLAEPGALGLPDPAVADVWTGTDTGTGTGTVIRQQQPRRFLPLYVLAWLGGSLAPTAMSGAAIPKLLTLLDPDTKEANNAIIVAVGGIVVMIITPLFGRLSDRTMSRWGMRKPWFAAGLVVGTAGAVVLSMSTTVWMLVIGWAIVQVGYGAVAMAAHTLLSDQIPTAIRARVAAAVGVAGGIALIAGSAIVAAMPIDQQWLWFVVPALVGIVTVAPILLGYRDARRTAPAAPLAARDILSTYWLDPRIYRDMLWAWLSRCLMTTSIFTMSIYMFFIIVDRLGVSVADAGGVQTLALALFFVGNAVSTVIFGWLSDRIGRRKVIIWISGLVSSTGLVVMLLGGGDMSMFLTGIVIVGIGQGAYISVDVALMTEVLPSAADAGKDLGIVALSYQLPQVIAPIVGAWIVATLGGYDGLLIFCVICGIIGGIAVLPVRGVR